MQNSHVANIQEESRRTDAKLERKAIEKANTFTTEVRQNIRDEEESVLAVSPDIKDLHAMLLRVGQRTIARLIQQIDHVQTKVCDLGVEYDEHHRLGNDVKMAAVDRNIFFGNSLIQSYQNCHVQEEKLNEEIRQDPTLQEFYLKQPDFVAEERARMKARKGRNLPEVRSIPLYHLHFNALTTHIIRQQSRLRPPLCLKR